MVSLRNRPTEIDTSSLFPHQRRGIEFLEQRGGRAGLFMGMRAGKTRVALAYLLPKAKRTLIVAPLSAFGVWEREARALGFEGEILLLLVGTSKQKAEQVKQCREGIIVTNYDSYWREELRKAITLWRPESVVLDEAQACKSRNSRRSRFAYALGMLPSVKYRLALSGTPVTNKLTDLFSIYRFIDPSVFGTSWSQFADRYLILGFFGTDDVRGYKNESELREKVRLTAYQVSKSEAWANLPIPRDEVIDVPLSTENRRRYDTMARDSLLEIVDEFGKRRTALGTIVLSKLMKLQQITSGFLIPVGDDDRARVAIDIGNEKLLRCQELVEEALYNDERVVVFCRFRRDIARLAELLKVKPEHVMTGDSSGVTRKKFEEEHLAGRVPVGICQLKVASLSWDLVQATTAVYYSVDFSVANFVQSKERLCGPAQKNIVNRYHLVCPGTVDEKVYRDLSRDIDIAGRVIDLDYVKGLFS